MPNKLSITAITLILLIANTGLAKEKKTKKKPKKVDFKLHVINPHSRFEAAYAFDVDNDGKIDIMNGGYWYQAPNWKKHFVREITEKHNYFDDFSNLPIDIDGDGWTDFVTCAWFNKQLSWIRNPGNTGGKFEEIAIDESGNNETAIKVDLNADGKPDIVPDILNAPPAWYEFKPDPSAKHGVKWTKHPLPQEISGPGI
ncbi:MAG: FG-GAP repeat domain-containing protein, partial [Planctomycetota bacterium]